MSQLREIEETPEYMAILGAAEFIGVEPDAFAAALIVHANILARESVMPEPDEFVLVPKEPTVEMAEAAFKSIRFWNKGSKACVELWAPNAGKRHPHEPGIVTEIRAAIAAGSRAKEKENGISK